LIDRDKLNFWETPKARNEQAKRDAAKKGAKEHWRKHSQRGKRWQTVSRSASDRAE